jgi:hypothetical protein
MSARVNPIFYLPLKKTYKHGAKTTILIIPGAQSMDVSQLKEIIQWQDEKEAKIKEKPIGVIPKEAIKEQLFEFAKHVRKKRMI